MDHDRSIGPGDHIGHYVVVDALGQGAMGVVLRAFDPRLQRRVALKLVNPEYARGSEARTRLVEEARALARLSHPNVVPVFDAGVHEGSVYVAMELVDGVDLARWLATGPHARRDVLRVFVDAARGLDAAHQAGLVHRDFKPSNVLLGSDGRARVVDFGLARSRADSRPIDAALPPITRTSALGPNTSGLTNDGMVMGTPHYMAPEQHYGEPVTPAADQYAFCVSLWEALYGARPFAGKRALELVAAKRQPPSRPPEGSDVPRALFEIVARGLQHDAGERFASMRELIAELRRTQRSRRRFVLPAIAIAVVAVALPLSALRAQRPCDGARHVHDVWNPSIAEEIERSFTTSDRAFARDAWARTSSVLDDWFARWTKTFDEACRAASETDLDHAMACLDARLHDADALLGAFADADENTVSKAVEAARRLAPADACASPQLWLSSQPLPVDPGQRDPVQAVRTEIARAHALAQTGRYTEGLAIANAAATSAAAIGFAPVEAEALAQLASLQEDNADTDAAAVSFERAYFLASESGHDLAATRAAVGLTWLEGEGRYDFETARRWAGLAHASLERAGGDAVLAAELENALGAIASYQGLWDEALGHYARVPEVVGDRDMLAFSAIVNAGVVHLRRDDNASARRSFSDAIAWASRELGPDHPRVALVHDLLGGTLRADGELDQAIAEHRMAVEILERGLGPDHGEVSGPLMNLARALDDAGDDETALSLYQRALAIAEAHGKAANAGVALNNLGHLLADEGYFDAARAYLRRSLALHEREYGPDDSEVAYPLLGLGGVAAGLGLYDEALVHYERALEVTKAEGSDRMHATALNRIAGVRQAQGDLEEALRLYRLGLATFERIDGGSAMDVATALTDVGETLVQMRREAEARPILERALAIYGDDRGKPRMRAQARFLLAQALWPDASERARAVRLVEDAIVAFEADGSTAATDLADAQAWLREHAPTHL